MSSMSPARSSEKSRRSVFRVATSVKAQHRHEGLLRDLDIADALHPRLTRLRLLEELALARDVAAVALGDDVLAECRDGLAGHDLAPDGGLDRDLEHLSGDQGFEFPRQLAALLGRVLAGKLKTLI